MSMERGSAIAVVLVVLCLVALQYEVARAATYTVGGMSGWSGSGWSFDSGGWPTGKSFRAGDVLVFKYNPSIHNVVAVNGRGYNSCIMPQGAKVYQSGNDSIRLVKGQNFFVCSVASHCQVGMRMAVNAV